MRGRSLPIVLVALLWGLVAARFALAWDQLPANMASHFGPTGRADGWMSRGAFVVFTAVVEGGVTLVLLTVPLWLRRIPVSLINLPNRDYWLADGRAPESIERVGRWLAWFAVAMAALMAGVNELVLRANLSGGPLPGWPFGLLLGAFLLFTVGWIVALYRSWRVPEPRGQSGA